MGFSRGATAVKVGLTPPKSSPKMIASGARPAAQKQERKVSDKKAATVQHLCVLYVLIIVLSEAMEKRANRPKAGIHHSWRIRIVDGYIHNLLGESEHATREGRGTHDAPTRDPHVRVRVAGGTRGRHICFNPFPPVLSTWTTGSGTVP